MKIAVDFDHTLLRSQELLIKTNDFVGIPLDDFLTAYSKIKRVYKFYKIKLHAREIIRMYPNLEINSVINGLSKYYELVEEYLYPDATKFLRELENHEVHIVSIGDLIHQSKVIVSSKVYKYVNKVLIVEDKNFDNGYDIVVGDSKHDLILAEANNAKFIRVKRGKYANEVLKSDYEVKNLIEALEVIKCME